MAAQGLTKEERDKLVDQRVAAAKEKNEAIRRRQKLIEEEKKALGEAAAPPSTTLKGSDGWRKPENDEGEGPRSRGSQWPGENAEEKPSTWDKNTSDKSARGRGNRGPRTPRGGRGIAEGDSQSVTPHSRGRGRGGTPGSGRLPERNAEYEKSRKENALAMEQEMKSGADMPSHSSQFLSDSSRSSGVSASPRTNEEARVMGNQQTHRHPRNYGGQQQMDLREKIKRERQRKSGDQFNPDLHMTGKERLDHNKWKMEQQQYDQQRVERAKSKQGGWRREWDADKNTPDDQAPPPEYGIYKEIDNKKSAANQRPEMKGMSNGPKARSAGRGRGRGRGASTDPSAMKVADQPKLEVTIDTRGGNPHTVVVGGSVSPNKSSQHNVSSKHRQGSHAHNAHSHDAGNFHSDRGERHGGSGYRGGGPRGGGKVRPTGDVSVKQGHNLPNKDKTESVKHKGEARDPVQPSQKGHTQQTAKSELHSTADTGHTQGEDVEAQEIIVTEDDNDDGWVDVDSDEDCQTEEVVSSASRDKTPTPTVPRGSKEATPSPSATVNSAKPESASKTASQSTGTKLPAKPELHIDIRDPVDDIFKTPEEGRQKLDWAAEMEDASPVIDPQLNLNS